MKKMMPPQTSMNEIGWLDNRSQICNSYSCTIQRSAKLLKVPLYSSEKENEVALQWEVEHLIFCTMVPLCPVY